MVSIALVLMGCGGVGRQLLQHIVSCRNLHAKQGVRIRVVGVCDSKWMMATPNVLKTELDDQFLTQVCKLKSSGSPLVELASFGECQVLSGHEIPRKVCDVAATLQDSNHRLALVDCTASSKTISILNRVLELGSCVVLANKKPLTSSLEDHDKLVSRPRHIRHEPTVGAGLPVMSTINRLLSSGDPIYRILGSLSGTLGYVMSEVEGGKPFSQVIKDAKKLGYTEPDPRDDLSGMDVARKALILGRLLGYRINLESIKIESLYPVEMGPDVLPMDDFLVNGLPLLDEEIRNRVEKASSNGNVLRYVCVIEESRCEVGIQEVAKDSALGRLQGSDNVLEIYSRCYKQRPLVIQGAGAGNDTTAAGVLADILDLQDLFQD